MAASLSILHLEDDENDARLVAHLLKTAEIACSITLVQDKAEFVAALARRGFDLILADFSLPAFDGISALGLVRAQSPDLPFILVSGSLGEEVAVDALKSGATDFVLKGRLSRLVPAIRRAMLEIDERAAHQRVERALRQSEARLQTVVESLAEGVIVADLDGRYLHWNHAALQLHGEPLVEDWRRRAVDFADTFELSTLDGVVLPVEDWPIMQILRGAVLSDFAARTRRLHGDWDRILNYGGSVVRDGDGRPTMAIVTVSDITERKRGEEHLRRASEDLKRANISLVERNMEIQNFYHTLSHELKTPLTSAREFLSIVMDGLAGPLNTHQTEFLGIAIESCDQLRLYVNDLLDVTRLETGKMRLELQPVDLGSLVQRVVETLLPAASGKGLTLTYRSPSNLPAIPLDQHRVQQVLTNLTTNAIKFTEAGGKIHLALSEADDGSSLLVTVRDTGRGIPEGELGLIFTRLHQSNRDDLSSESRSGLGLGLYICQELIQMHGGRIWVESEPGKGSVFSFTVPKKQSPIPSGAPLVHTVPDERWHSV